MTNNSSEELRDEIEKIVTWAFHHGWNERARMTGVNKNALDKHHYKRLEIVLANQLYKDAAEPLQQKLNEQAQTILEKDAELSKLREEKSKYYYELLAHKVVVDELKSELSRLKADSGRAVENDKNS